MLLRMLSLGRSLVPMIFFLMRLCLFSLPSTFNHFFICRPLAIAYGTSPEYNARFHMPASCYCIWNLSRIQCEVSYADLIQSPVEGLYPAPPEPVTALPALRRTCSPTYFIPLPLYGSGL